MKRALLVIALTACRGTAPPVAPVLATKPVVTPKADSCREDNPIPVRLVRLAHSELIAHLGSILGDAVVKGPGAPVFHLQGDHTHAANERVMSSVDFSSYRGAARLLAKRYVASLPPDAVCLDPAASLVCSHGPLRTLMLALHRHNLGNGDWLRMERVFLDLARKQDPATALEAVVTATLLSPAVLYRTEAGSPGTDVRTMSREETLDMASFSILGHAPDPASRDEVLRFSGTEFQPYLARVARNWTRTPAFHDRAVDFVQEWLGVSHLRDKLVRPGTTGGGDGKPDITFVLLNEFNAFVKDNLLAETGSFSRLFTATETRYFPALEDIYSGRFLPPDRIVWDERERKGVLGLSGLLAAHASEQASDPVQRGMLVRLRILCEPMPPPIPNADIGKIGVTPDMQTRERFEALASAPACRSCHTVINPPGYLFESFDQHGRYRSVEKGRPINDRGGLPAFFGQEPYEGVGAWSGIVELADWISTAPSARLCFAREFSNYILAAQAFDQTEGCGLRRIASRFVKSGQVADLVEDLVASESFRRRQPQPLPAN